MFAPPFRRGNVNLSFSPAALGCEGARGFFRGVIEEFFIRSKERAAFGKMIFRKESL